MMELTRLVESAERRVSQARRIADELRDDARLHRLTMQTVFVLEDALFALRQVAPRDGHMPGIGPKL